MEKLASSKFYGKLIKILLSFLQVRQVKFSFGFEIEDKFCVFVNIHVLNLFIGFYKLLEKLVKRVLRNFALLASFV